MILAQTITTADRVVSQAHSVPTNLAYAALAYSLVTWLGMSIFGRETWLRGGEAFSVVFGLLARFSLLEVRVAGPTSCAHCTSASCHAGSDECVNCYECFSHVAQG